MGTTWRTAPNGARFEAAQTPAELAAARGVLALVSPVRVVELGTWHYGFCAEVHAVLPECEIVTFDHLVRVLTVEQMAWMEGWLRSIQADVHNQPWIITDELSREVSGPTLLWCDAGRRLLLVQQ